MDKAVKQPVEDSTYVRGTYTHQEGMAVDSRSSIRPSSLPIWAVQSLFTRTVTIRNRVFPILSDIHKRPSASSPPYSPTSVGSRRSSVGEMERSSGDQGFYQDVARDAVAAATPPHLAPGRGVQSGVDWRWGQQGTMMINNAMAENSPSKLRRSSSFERQSYIDGVTYLLQGLPEDLNDEEKVKVRRSLPRTLFDDSAPADSTKALTSQPAVGTDRNVLHKSMKTLVVNFIVLTQFVLPYIIYLFTQAAQLERKYKITESVVGQTVELGHAVGRGSATLSTAILTMGDGRVGRIMTDACTSVLGGISDGLGEGINIVRARNGPGAGQ